VPELLQVSQELLQLLVGLKHAVLRHLVHRLDWADALAPGKLLDRDRGPPAARAWPWARPVGRPQRRAGAHAQPRSPEPGGSGPV